LAEVDVGTSASSPELDEAEESFWVEEEDEDEVI